jgi:plastocyanin
VNRDHRSDIEVTDDLSRAGQARHVGKTERGGMEMGHWRKLLVVGATLGLAVLLGGCAGETASGDVRPGPAGQGAMRVIMKDEVFEPNILEVPAGSPVTIEVRNFGDESHNLTIDALDTSTGAMETGDVMTVTFTAPRGTTEFRCTWHPDMVGRIVAT